MSTRSSHGKTRNTRTYTAGVTVATECCKKAGLAYINSEDSVFADPLAIAILIDVFTERGFTAVVDIRKMEVPERIDPKSYEIINKVKKGGPTVLFQGALGNALASFVGNYPWYLTFNFLQEAIPVVSADQLLLKLMRAALCGFLATCVSDCTSNSIRVLKTTRQTSATEISYREAATQIIEKEGIKGLFGRGLGTRILTNGVQASLFTIIWKYLEEFYFKV